MRIKVEVQIGQRLVSAVFHSVGDVQEYLRLIRRPATITLIGA